MNKKATKRRRNMRNTVIMALLCMALLGSATYAWFTLSESAKVTNLTLQVGGGSGLLIADEEDGDYSSEYELTNFTKKLMPATIGTYNGDLGIYKPKTIVSNEVTELDPLAEATDIAIFNPNGKTFSIDTNAYACQYDFWLKVNAAGTYDIALEGSTWQDAEPTAADGTWVYEVADTVVQKPVSTAIAAANTMKIAFYAIGAGDPELKAIYEPNADLSASVADKSGVTTKAGVLTAWDTNVIQQGYEGKFSGNNTSGTLFSIEGDGVANHMRMVIYFDGDDSHCIDEVALENIVGQLKFVSTAQ